MAQQELNKELNRYEIIILDQDYHKKGEDLESLQRWKLLDREQSSLQESTKFAQSNIIIGPGQLCAENTQGLITSQNNLQTSSSNQIAFLPLQRILLISVDNKLLVYDEEQFQLLISKNDSTRARPRVQKLNTSEQIKCLYVSQSQEYLAIQSENLINWCLAQDLVNGGDMIRVFDVNAIIKQCQWQSDNTLSVIMESDQIMNLTFHNKEVKKELVQNQNKIISGDSTRYIYQNGNNYFISHNNAQYILRQVPMSHISLLYVVDEQNYILCGYNSVDNDEEEEEDGQEYSCIIVGLRVKDGQVSFSEFTFESEMRQRKNIKGDFNVNKIENKTLDLDKNLINSIVYVVSGSNIENIFLLQLLNGQLNVLQRLKDSSILDISLSQAIRGSALIFQSSNQSDAYTGIALNGKFYLNYRLPSLLCLNNKLQLIQYQLIDFNLHKLEALTNDRQKYEQVLQRQENRPKNKSIFTTNVASLQQAQSSFFPSQRLTSVPVTGLFTSQILPSLQTHKINNQFKSTKAQKLENYVLVETLEHEIKKLADQPHLVEIELKSTMGGQIVCGIGQFTINENIENLQQSSNLFVHNKKHSLTILGLNDRFYQLNAQNLQDINLKKQNLQGCKSTQSFKLITYLCTFDDLLIVSSKEEIVAYTIKDNQFTKNEWVLSISKLKKIEFSNDGLTILIQEETKVTILKVENNNKIQEVKVINNVNAGCFFNGGILYNQSQILTYDDLFQQTILTQRYQTNQFSYLHQITDDKFYGSYCKFQNSKIITFHENVFKIDLLSKVVEKESKFLKSTISDYFKDVFIDDYDGDQINWSTTRLSLSYIEGGIVIKETNFVVIFCNLLIDGYILQIVNNELIPLMENSEDYIYIPSYSNLVQGLAFVDNLLPEEEKLSSQVGFNIIKRNGEKYLSHILPSLYLLEFNQVDTIKLHRFSLFNLDIQELKRDKKNAGSLVQLAKSIDLFQNILSQPKTQISWHSKSDLFQTTQPQDMTLVSQPMSSNSNSDLFKTQAKDMNFLGLSLAPKPTNIDKSNSDSQKIFGQNILKTQVLSAPLKIEEILPSSQSQAEVRLQQIIQNLNIGSFTSRKQVTIDQMKSILQQYSSEQDSLKKEIQDQIDVYNAHEQQVIREIERKNEIRTISDIIFDQDPTMMALPDKIIMQINSVQSTVDYQSKLIQDLQEIYLQALTEGSQKTTNQFIFTNQTLQIPSVTPNFNNQRKPVNSDLFSINRIENNTTSQKSDRQTQFQQECVQAISVIRFQVDQQQEVKQYKKKSIDFKSIAKVSPVKSSQQSKQKDKTLQQLNETLWASLSILIHKVKPTTYGKISYSIPKDYTYVQRRKNGDINLGDYLGDLTQTSEMKKKQNFEPVKQTNVQKITSFGAEPTKQSEKESIFPSKISGDTQIATPIFSSMFGQAQTGLEKKNLTSSTLKINQISNELPSNIPKIDNAIKMGNMWGQSSVSENEQFAIKKMKNTSVSHNLNSLDQQQAGRSITIDQLQFPVNLSKQEDINTLEKTSPPIDGAQKKQKTQKNEQVQIQADNTQKVEIPNIMIRQATSLIKSQEQVKEEQKQQQSIFPQADKSPDLFANQIPSNQFNLFNLTNNPARPTLVDTKQPGLFGISQQPKTDSQIPPAFNLSSQGQTNGLFGTQSQVGGPMFGGSSMFDQPRNPKQGILPTQTQSISQLQFGSISSVPQSQTFNLLGQSTDQSVAFNLNNPPTMFNLPLQNNKDAFTKARK